MAENPVVPPAPRALPDYAKAWFMPVPSAKIAWLWALTSLTAASVVLLFTETKYALTILMSIVAMALGALLWKYLYPLRRVWRVYRQGEVADGEILEVREETSWVVLRFQYRTPPKAKKAYREQILGEQFEASVRVRSAELATALESVPLQVLYLPDDPEGGVPYIPESIYEESLAADEEEGAGAVGPAYKGLDPWDGPSQWWVWAAVLPSLVIGMREAPELVIPSEAAWRATTAVWFLVAAAIVFARMLVTARRGRKKRRKMSGASLGLWVLVAVGLGYATSSSVPWLNRRLDRSPAEVFEVEVVEVGAEGSRPSHVLRVTSWLATGKTIGLIASRRFQSDVDVRDRLILTMRSGALGFMAPGTSGWPWIEHVRNEPHSDVAEDLLRRLERHVVDE